MKSRPFFQRYGYAILVLFAACTPLFLDAAIKAVQSNKNNVQDWLPATFRETGDLAWFRQHFAGDQFIIISWDGCEISGQPGAAGEAGDDPRIAKLANALTGAAVAEDAAADETHPAGDAPAGDEPEGDRANEQATTGVTAAQLAPGDPSVGTEATRITQYFKSVTTARQLLNQLTSPPLNVSFPTAMRRLQGNLIGPDGKTTCVVAMLSNDAIDHFREILGRGTQGRLRMHRPAGILFSTLERCGIPADSVHLGGPPVDNVSIDEEGERTLIRLAGLSGLLGLGLAWWSLRSVKLTVIVYSCGILSATLGLAAVNLTGQRTDAILLSMPALVFVLGISGAIHLVNHYREALESGDASYAVGRAVAHGWKPAVLCSLTTSFGLLSLNGSDLVPISKFGTYSAAGVMLSLIVLFTFLPAALQFWKPRVATASRPKAPPEVLGDPKRQPTGWQRLLARLNPVDPWGRFGGWIIRHHARVSIGCFSLIFLIGWGITRVDTTIDLLKLFDGKARILQDYRWLESNVGRLVPLEVAVRFSPSIRANDSRPNSEARKQLALFDRIAFVTSIQQHIDGVFGRKGSDIVGPSLSAATFIPPLPRNPRGMSGIVRRTTLNSQLQQSYEALLDSGYLTIDKQNGNELWRISVRVAAFKDVDYGQFTEELRDVVDPLLLAQNQKLRLGGDEAISAVYTGVVPIVYKAQRALLDSLVQSTIWSFVTITPLLMLVSRGVRAGLVTMLPNVLPVLVIFGGMGWLGIAVDIGSMMSASIALGVAVDDTIHYLTWFRDDLKRGGGREQAILAAYRRCALPTLQASLVNGLGLSVFALSTFTPTKQFGFLMLTILIAGVVAELILLPALLAGPMGRVFDPRPSKRLEAEPKEAPNSPHHAHSVVKSAGLRSP